MKENDLEGVMMPAWLCILMAGITTVAAFIIWWVLGVIVIIAVLVFIGLFIKDMRKQERQWMS